MGRGEHLDRQGTGRIEMYSEMTIGEGLEVVICKDHQIHCTKKVLSPNQQMYHTIKCNRFVYI